MHRCVFGFRGLRITVHSRVVAPLGWLEDFLSPFRMADDTGGSRQSDITLVIDDPRYTALVSEPGSAAGRPIDGFALDGTFQQLELWRDTPGERLLHDSNAQAFFAIGAGHRTIQITARSDHARLRVSLMRLVRELATLQALDRGDLLIHGAGAVSRGRAIIVAGPKQSGKTTMLLGLLRRGQARYLANDRVVIDLSGTSPVARSVPTIANVRADSLSYLPSFTVPVADPSQRYYLTAEESASGSPLIEPTKRAWPPMSPSALCRWLGVPSEAAAPVGMLVFPRVDPTVDRFILRDLSEADAADRIHTSLFSSGSAGPVPEAFKPGWEGTVPSQDDTLEACRRLARHAAAWECRLGPRALHAPDVWDAIAATAR